MILLLCSRSRKHREPGSMISEEKCSKGTEASIASWDEEEDIIETGIPKHRWHDGVGATKVAAFLGAFDALFMCAGRARISVGPRFTSREERRRICESSQSNEEIVLLVIVLRITKCHYYLINKKFLYRIKKMMQKPLGFYLLQSHRYPARISGPRATEQLRCVANSPRSTLQ